jgi:hypothetical protein
MKAKIIKSLLLTPGLNNRMGIPAVYRGKPGVGKSSVITQVVNDLGMHCEIVLASVREPSDFLGLPIPSKGGKGVEYAPPQWARRAAEAGDAVVFFDEINTAPPSVQAALLRGQHVAAAQERPQRGRVPLREDVHEGVEQAEGARRLELEFAECGKPGPGVASRGIG